MSTIFEHQETINDCCDLIDALISSDTDLLEVAKPHGRRGALARAALETMGVIERKSQCVWKLVVNYKNRETAREFVRAHYSSLCAEQHQNYEMLCDGLDPFVEPISEPSTAKLYADRAGSFEQFLGLCIEHAERRLPAEEVLESVELSDIPSNIFDLCVDAYEDITGPHKEIYDHENIVHRTLIESGIVSFRHGDQLVGKRYSGHPEGEAQLTKHFKACKFAPDGSEVESGFAWAVAQDERTVRGFIKKCAESAAAEMSAERLDKFHEKLSAVGCP